MRQRNAVQPNSPVRLVYKNGGTNIKGVGIRGWRKHYVTDLFTTMVEITWYWNIFIFVSGFVITWLLFATYYWIVGHLHGDFDDVPKNWSPCVANVKSFVSAYLFSIETQSTIGYGLRSVTEECPIAYIGVLIQSIIGAGLQAGLAGLVVAKVRRAKKRSRTILFSTVACVVEEDGDLKLTVRVGDMRRSNALGVSVMGYFFQKKQSKSGKTFPVKYLRMNFKGEDNNPQIFMSWPTHLVHVIDKKSPLWKISRDDLYKENFEIIIILYGTSAATSMPFRAQTSYLPWDVKWGHRFDTMRRNKSGTYIVDFANFHKTHAVSVPFCSASALQEMINVGLPVPRSNAKRPDNLSECDVDIKYREPVVKCQSNVNDAYAGSSQDINFSNHPVAVPDDCQ